MNVLLFPGQGSQTVSMGAEFFNNFELVKNIFKILMRSYFQFQKLF